MIDLAPPASSAATSRAAFSVSSSARVELFGNAEQLPRPAQGTSMLKRFLTHIWQCILREIGLDGQPSCCTPTAEQRIARLEKELASLKESLR